MIPMQVVRLALQIDITNTKEFYVGCRLGSQVFYVYLENIHGEIENVTHLIKKCLGVQQGDL
jgi:hypothetical protein